MKNEVKPRLYDVLARVFAQEGVRTCFALLGDANMNWASRLSEAGCRMVYVRHEHCALAAAMAYSRKTRDVGVATAGAMAVGSGVEAAGTAIGLALGAEAAEPGTVAGDPLSAVTSDGCAAGAATATAECRIQRLGERTR